MGRTACEFCGDMFSDIASPNGNEGFFLSDKDVEMIDALSSSPNFKFYEWVHGWDGDDRKTKPLSEMYICDACIALGPHERGRWNKEHSKTVGCKDYGASSWDNYDAAVDQKTIGHTEIYRLHKAAPNMAVLGRPRAVRDYHLRTTLKSPDDPLTVCGAPIVKQDGTPWLISEAKALLNPKTFEEARIAANCPIDKTCDECRFCYPEVMSNE